MANNIDEETRDVAPVRSSSPADKGGGGMPTVPTSSTATDVEESGEDVGTRTFDPTKTVHYMPNAHDVARAQSKREGVNTGVGVEGDVSPGGQLSLFASDEGAGGAEDAEDAEGVSTVADTQEASGEGAQGGVASGADDSDSRSAGFYDSFLQESEEERKKRERKERRNKVIAGIGDVLSAFSNLYFTTRGGLNTWNKGDSQAAQLDERYKKDAEEREKKRKNYFDAYVKQQKMNNDKTRTEVALRDQARKEADSEAKRIYQQQKAEIEADLNSNKISELQAREALTNARREQVENATRIASERYEQYAAESENRMYNNTRRTNQQINESKSRENKNNSGGGGSSGGSSGKKSSEDTSEKIRVDGLSPSQTGSGTGSNNGSTKLPY